MPIETSVTHIADLEPLYPLGTDNRLQGDNHIRNIKTALKNDLPLTTPATSTGIALLTAANAAAARTALGSTTVGDAVYIASSQAAAQSALGVYSESEVDALIAASSSTQIQTVAASVASNDLTVTINPTKLDFRSTTLTSGTITTVDLASAASLVVPSGATLGTTNSVSARLVILAINNAGTIEAAIVNVAGGIGLSETGLISTTALSTGSDSANVAYSTAARTSVAYRVVGFLDISETTAGTWATAPTLVQGAGGLSLDGFGETTSWQDVTGSRAIGTTYYNTSGRLRKVIIRARSTNLDEGASAVTLRFSVNGATLDDFSTVQWDNVSSKYFMSMRTVFFEVPAGQSYALTNQVGTSSLQSWREL